MELASVLNMRPCSRFRWLRICSTVLVHFDLTYLDVKFRLAQIFFSTFPPSSFKVEISQWLPYLLSYFPTGHDFTENVTDVYLFYDTKIYDVFHTTIAIYLVHAAIVT